MIHTGYQPDVDGRTEKVSATAIQRSELRVS